MPSSLGLKLFCVVYFGFLLLNLHHLPLPWIDEIGYLDPAWNWYQTNNFASNLWPHHGADQLFLAHLPALQWLHYIGFILLPKTVWMSRLLPVFCFAGGLLFWVKSAEKQSIIGWLLVAFLVLFVCDRSVFEGLRSMRMENLELLFTGLIFYRIYTDKKTLWTGFFIGLLVLTHPKMWMIALVAFLWLIWFEKAWKKRLLLVLGTMLPIAFFFYSIDFNFSEFYAQLIDHGSDHTASTINGNLFFNHFIGRYLLYQPKTAVFEWYYSTQPYVVIVAALALFYAIKSIFKNTGNLQPYFLEVVLVLNHVYWFLVVGPFQKYNMVVLAMSYVLVIKYNLPLLQCSFRAKWSKWLIPPMIMLIVFPVASRHTGALVQWKNRDVERFNQWVVSQTDPGEEEKVLFIECASLWYHTRSSVNHDFQLKFWLFKNEFEDYDEVFFITNEDYPFELVNTYPNQSSEWSKSLQNVGGITHEGMRIYRMDEQGYASLIDYNRMRKN